MAEMRTNSTVIGWIFSSAGSKSDTLGSELSSAINQLNHKLVIFGVILTLRMDGYVCVSPVAMS